MITNYYTLRLIALDLRRRFTDASLSRVFTQHRDELVITCTTNESEGHIVVSCETGKNFILCRDEFPRAKRNSIDLFEKLGGARVRDIRMHPVDRQIIFRTDGPYRLVIQLYGSRANVFMVDEANVIQGAFLKPKEFVGQVVAESPPSPAVGTVTDLRQRLQSGDSLLASTLKRCFPQYGPEISAELMYRAGLEAENVASQLTGNSVERLFALSLELERQLTDHAAPRIYFDGSVARTFSIIELQRMQKLRVEEFDSVYVAIRTFLGSTKKQSGFEEERKRLAGILHQSLTKTERTLGKIAEEEETLARAANHELKGKVLMAHLQSLQKGMKQVELEDPSSTSTELLTIVLDPALTPAKNAGRYFEKAKKIRLGIQENSERKAALQQRMTVGRELLERLDTLDEETLFAEFLAARGETLREFGYKAGSSAKAKQAETVPFRIFTVAGGFQVWAGKSSENNDLLTMKYSKPNDLWFHARGSSGSHVVLKIGTANGEPSKLAIQQAAGIAAYYSKMKGSKLVPVAMTERKHVRKPRGVPAGTVTLEREKTIFAEPRLPAV